MKNSIFYEKNREYGNLEWNDDSGNLEWDDGDPGISNLLPRDNGFSVLRFFLQTSLDSYAWESRVRRRKPGNLEWGDDIDIGYDIDIDIAKDIDIDIALAIDIDTAMI